MKFIRLAERRPGGHLNEAFTLVELTEHGPRMRKSHSQLCAWFHAAALIGLLLASGCSRSIGPDVQFVEGLVLLDGEPLANASVGFNPESPTGVAASGQTNPEGIFTLTSARAGGRGRGAVVGAYVVTVRKYRNLLGELAPMPDPDADPAGAAKWQAEADRLGRMPRQSLLPEVYGDKATSPLRAEVRKGRNIGAEFTLQLKSEGGPAR